MNRSENARAFCRLLAENPVIAAIKDGPACSPACGKGRSWALCGTA